MSGIRTFPRRAPRTPQELDYFYLAIIEKLKETPTDLSGLEILFWLLHEDGNPDVGRLDESIAALQVMFEGERPADPEILKALQDLAVSSTMTLPIDQTARAQAADAEIIAWMGV